MLNDYLYSGDTVLKILKKYSEDLADEAEKTGMELDRVHARFLSGILDMLVHNDFLTYQSNRIKEFYKYMADRYPFLAFTFKGRIKSLIRSEEKFNGYVVEYIYNYYLRHHAFPPSDELFRRVTRFRDFIAYRIVISMPACHIKPGEDRHEVEEKYLYEIAEALPQFLSDREFTPERSGVSFKSSRLSGGVRDYYRDYVETPKDLGYRSLHIAFYDKVARSYIEVQLRTQEMDDYAEIGQGNHANYEQKQNANRTRREMIEQGQCLEFDEAYAREKALQELDLSKVDVNMFCALDNVRMNDCCGLYHGRLILPFEHLSRFQNDLV